jgi:hypothetical protein
MRFSTLIALSTLSLGATAAAIPLPKPVGEGSAKSIQTARDLDALEGRGLKGVLFGGLAAAGIYHLWHKHNQNKAANNPPSAPPAYDERELLDDDFEARDLDNLEGRGLGKVLLGAGAGALLVHEIDKHLHHSETAPADVDAPERRGLGKVLLGAGAGALLVHEVEKHMHQSDKAPEVDAPERRGLGKVLLGAGAGALLVHEVEKHMHQSDKTPEVEAPERRGLGKVLLGAGAGALLVHEIEKHTHHSDNAPEADAPERRDFLERRRLPLVL